MPADVDETVSAEIAPAPRVQVIDSPLIRVHRLTDLLAMAATAVGILATLLVSAYAIATAEGITEDIQNISPTLQRLLVAPVNIFSGVVTLVIPAVIIISLFARKEPRRVLEAIGASIAGFALAGTAAFLIYQFGSETLVRSLSVPDGDELTLQIPAYMSAVAAMLTAAGRRTTRRSISVSWTVLWIAAAVATISGIVTAPAAILTILIGRVAGLAVRYAIGSTADRAYGDVLVGAIERAGFSPRRLVRADATRDYVPDGVDEVTEALAHTRVGRVYSLTTTQNHHLFVVALDGDQHVAGLLSKLWSTLRLRGLATRADVSLRHSAQTTALASHAARTAGVRSPRVMGMASARDTFVLVYQRPVGVRPLGAIAPEEVTDAMMDALWLEVLRAHAANIAHRALTADTVMFTDVDSDDPHAWLTSWELGELATSDLAIRIDRAQVVALLAPIVGAERAVESAFRNFPAEDVEKFAPLLQAIALPRPTRAALKAAKPTKVLEEVREGILARLPDADVETENITRFGGRTIVTVILAAVAIFVIAGFNTQSLVDALRQANLWWLLIALVWSVLTYVGAAFVLIAFSPVKLPWMRAFLAQVAATYVALAAPAGVGPAALNMRMLSKRGVPAPLGVATVALIQVSSVVVTVTGLVTLTLTTGSTGTLANLPSRAILIGVGASIAVLALALLVPRVRKFVLAKVMPVIGQTWPRLSQVLGKPWRLGMGLGGNLLMTVGYIGAFYACLEAFGTPVAIVDLAIVFFIGNAAGAIIPTPGGVGPVELALTGALTGLGVDAGVAVSAVLIYRVITHFMNIPLGYVAMKFLERKGDV